MFDKMSQRNHVQVVHVFVEITSKLEMDELFLYGISLKNLKLADHTNNFQEILMDMSSVFVCIDQMKAVVYASMFPCCNLSNILAMFTMV